MPACLDVFSPAIVAWQILQLKVEVTASEKVQWKKNDHHGFLMSTVNPNLIICCTRDRLSDPRESLFLSNLANKTFQKQAKIELSLNLTS